MDFLSTLIPLFSLVFKLAPELVADAQKLADALRTHPDASVRPGAEHIQAAINGAANGG